MYAIVFESGIGELVLPQCAIIKVQQNLSVLGARSRFENTRIKW